MTKEKRKRNRPIDYDYEAAFPDELSPESIDDALEQARRRKGDVYATKEIRAGEQLEIEIYPEFKRGERKYIPPEARKRTNKAQRNLNARNSQKQCERMINQNFSDHDIWATLTYAPENAPHDMAEAQKNMKNYLRRLNRIRNKRGLANAKYIYVTECSASGRWHHHFVTGGDIDLDTVERTWKLGRRNQVRRLSKNEYGLSGMSRYLSKPATKNKTAKGHKMWTASLGLTKPRTRVNHKFKHRDVLAMVRNAGEIAARMLKQYSAQGYIFTASTVKYNDFNGRFYIAARLRRV